MRVQHNIAAINSNRNLSGNNSKVSKSLEKLSSGYRINRAGDDAAGLAISEKMRSQISGLTQAETNANDGISLIQTAEGALTETHSILNRMKELSVQSANGTYQKEDRDSIQDEIKSLITEVDRIAKGTNFNGTTVISGALATKALTFQIGENAGATYEMGITIKAMTSASLLITGLDLTTQATATAAITTIDTAIKSVSTQRGKLGAMQNRLEHTINNLSTTNENMTAAESRIRDTDMAKEMMAYTKNNILSQAAQSMLAQANQQPQQVLSLLQ